jgi:hypothetical protein
VLQRVIEPKREEKTGRWGNNLMKSFFIKYDNNYIGRMKLERHVSV